jgi:HK97 family phage major capsid protein/HK97 family phage prohead protease
MPPEQAERLKEFDALPMMRRNLTVTIVKHKKRTPEERAAAKASREALVAQHRAAGTEVPPDDSTEDDDDDGDGAPETYDITASSEQPVDRWFGREILDHDPKSVDLSRADPEHGLPLLSVHDGRSLPIGRVRKLKAKDGKLQGRLQPSASTRGQEASTLLKEGHRELSIGYDVSQYDYTPGKAGQPDTYRATKWQPMEISMVGVPADPTIGVGRAASDKTFPVHVRNAAPPQPRETPMPPDQAAAVTAATAAATKNSAEILRRAIMHKVPADTYTKWIEDGTSLERVNELILEFRATPAANQPSSEQLDLSAREAAQYSYTRAILAATNMAEGKRPEKSFELDLSEQLARTLPKQYAPKGGMLIPTALRSLKIEGKDGKPLRGVGLSQAQLRAMNEFLTRAGGSGTIDSQTANAIKEVVFTEYGGELIEILRNMALVVSMGARVLTGLSSPIGFPRQTADAIARWVGENPGSDTASSNVTTDMIVLTPRTLQAATAYSRQLLVQSSIDVEAMVRTSIAAAHALAWDLAALHGTGSDNMPLGIYNQGGVLTVDFSNAAYSNTGQKLAWTGVTQMEAMIASANALMGTLGYMTTPQIGNDGKNTLKFPGAAIAQGGPIWEGKLLDGEMNGYTAKCTNQVSKLLGANGASQPAGTFHGLIFGDWVEVLIGQFGGAMEMIVDPYTLKKQGLIEVASFQMADVAIRHPVSFCVAINLNP